MTTPSMVVDGIEWVPRHRYRHALARGYRRVRNVLSVVGEATATVARSKARPAAKQLQDHVYTIGAMACFDAAWFTHSVFTGLLWTAFSLVVFEFKLSQVEEPE